MERERPILDLLNVNIEDDRGRVRRCRMAGSLFWRSAYPSTFDPKLRSALRLATHAATDRGGAILGIFAGVVITLTFALAPASWPEIARWLLLGALIPIVWLTWDLLILGPQVRPAYRRQHKEAAIKHNHCPWCMYDLSQQPSEPDGCTLCPECGGAWKLKQAGQAKHPPFNAPAPPDAA